MKDTKQAYTVRLDPELLDRIKTIATDRGQSVTHIFESALESYLSHSIPIDDKQDILNRISKLERTVSELVTIKRKNE